MSALTTDPTGTAPDAASRTRRAASRTRATRSGLFGLGVPAIVWILFFFVIPFAQVAWYSFGYKPDLFTSYATDRLSLERYAEVAEPLFFTTFTTTLRIAIAGTLGCLLLATPFAYWLAVKVPRRWRSLLLAAVLIPYWSNFLVRTLGWQIILSPTGFLSGLLQSWHLTDGPLDILFTRAAVQLGVVYNYLPLMILPLFVAFDGTDPAQREAGRDLGAGPLRVWLTITLPAALPGIAAGCLLVFIPLMGDFITAEVLGGTQGAMVGQLVAMQFNYSQDWPLGAAMAITLMAMTLLCIGIVALLTGAVRAVSRVRRRRLLAAVGPLETASQETR